MLFFLYSFRVKEHSKFAWMLRIFAIAQILEYSIMIIQYFSYRMVLDPNINIQIYLRHIPMLIAYLIFFLVYVTTRYRRNMKYTITADEEIDRR